MFGSEVTSFSNGPWWRSMGPPEEQGCVTPWRDALRSLGRDGVLKSFSFFDVLGPE